MERKSTNSSSSSWALKPSAKLLSVDFYSRDTFKVAREVLGKILVVRSRGVSAARIVEVEAYVGSDPAAHSFRGVTPRSAPMFEAPGRAYVYFIYGMYEMLNFVTEPVDRAGAVLIRAVEPLGGLPLIARRRKGVPRSQWTNGPGRLTRAMGVRMSHNRQPLQGPVFEVWDDGYRAPSLSFSPRVGISEAREKPWRYFITGHPDVSRVKENRQARILNSHSRISLK